MSYCNNQRGKAKEMTDLTAELAFTVIRKGMQAETKTVQFSLLDILFKILNQAQLHANCMVQQFTKSCLV